MEFRFNRSLDVSNVNAVVIGYNFKTITSSDNIALVFKQGIIIHVEFNLSKCYFVCKNKVSC